MTAIFNVDSPDGQNGITTAQQVLAKLTAATASVVVTIPSNAETLVIMAGSTPGLATFTAIGVTSGYNYPVNISSEEFGSAVFGQYFVNVSNAVDSQITLAWTLAPGDGWIVYSDQAPHISFDPNVGQLVQLRDSPIGDMGVIAMGSDGTLQHPLKLDASGQLLVSIGSMLNPATTVTGPDAYGAAPVVGVGLDYARQDHDHGLPAASGGALTHANGALGAQAMVTGTSYTTFTSALAVGTWLILAGDDMNASGTVTTSPTSMQVALIGGGATYTTLGKYFSTLACVPTAAGIQMSVQVACLINVTVAGTIGIRSTGTFPAGNAMSDNNGFWSATKIA
jgi:hypothetical protein